MISWFSIRKNVRAMRFPSEDRISQRPAPIESTRGFPTGQAHCTARMSDPICLRSAAGRLFSHSLTGSLPVSVAKKRVASGRGAEGISLVVSKMMRLSKSGSHTADHLPRSGGRNGFRSLWACHVTQPSNFFQKNATPFPISPIRFSSIGSHLLSFAIRVARQWTAMTTMNTPLSGFILPYVRVLPPAVRRRKGWICRGCKEGQARRLTYRRPLENP